MARTPLATALQQIGADIGGSGDVSRPTRRQLLAGGAGAAAAAAALRFAPAARAADPPRIVVVGAGLAGLTCAYRLKQAGYTAQVHEASDRIGGRCWSIRGVFADGQIAEHGGELIDQGHTALRQLAQELGLTLDNLLAGERNGTVLVLEGWPVPGVRRGRVRDRGRQLPLRGRAHLDRLPGLPERRRGDGPARGGRRRRGATLGGARRLRAWEATAPWVPASANASWGARPCPAAEALH